MDPEEMVAQAQERFAEIRRDPEKALFSEYKGVSPRGMADLAQELGNAPHLRQHVTAASEKAAVDERTTPRRPVDDDVSFENRTHPR